MVKYKLIKEYPGSPKIGTECTQLENDTIDAYPEFWEKVEEEVLCVPIGTWLKHYSKDQLYKIRKGKTDSTVNIYFGFDSTDYKISLVNTLIKDKLWIPVDIEEEVLFTAREIEQIWNELIFSGVSGVINLKTQLKKEVNKKLEKKLEEKLENGK